MKGTLEELGVLAGLQVGCDEFERVVSVGCVGAREVAEEGQLGRVGVAQVAHDTAHAVAAVQKEPHDVAPNEARRACTHNAPDKLPPFVQQCVRVGKDRYQ